MIAAIGSDGNSLVVWGLGVDETAAEFEAQCNGTDAGCDPEVCGYVPVNEEQVAQIEAGTVHLDALGLKYRYHNGVVTPIEGVAR